MIGDILQPTHLVFILIVALLVLGPKRLPEVGRSLGKGLRDFRGALAGIEAEASSLLDHDEPQAPVNVPAVASTATVAPSAPTLVSRSSRTEPTVVAASSYEPDPADYAD